jgi:hypothetical protein
VLAAGNHRPTHHQRAADAGDQHQSRGGHAIKVEQGYRQHGGNHRKGRGLCGMGAGVSQAAAMNCAAHKAFRNDHHDISGGWTDHRQHCEPALPAPQTARHQEHDEDRRRNRPT